MRAGALALLVVLCAGCAAKQPQPEIVGREYATRISGDGVVEAEDTVATLEEPFDDEDYGTHEDARAASDEINAMLAEPGFTEEHQLRVLEISRAGGTDGTRVVIQLSRTPESWKSSELSGPPRCMVDVHAPTAEDFGPRSVETGDALAPRVRVGHYPDRLRLVVDQSAAMAGRCDVEVDESAVVVSLGGSPGDAPAVDVWETYDMPPGAHAHAATVLARASGASAPPTQAEPASKPPLPDPADIGEPYAAAPPPPLPDPGPAGPPGDTAQTRIPPSPPSPYVGGSRQAGDVIVDGDASAAPRRKVYNGRRISLEFKDADILNVLRIIADVAHRNIVATDDVTGRVTIVLYDVPWDQALDILLKSTGLEMVEYDDVITISTAKRLEEERKARLAAQQAGRQLEPLQTAYLKVNYVKARDLAELLRGKATNSAAGAMAAADIANESAGQRRGLLSGRGTVMVNDATNTLIVRDISDGIANSRELVRRLDVQTPQVAIQGLIFEADTDIGRDLGVRWGASYIASPETGNPTGKNFPGRIAVGGAGPRDTIDAADGEGGATAATPILVDFPASGVAAGAGSTLGLVLGSLDGSSQIDAEVTAIEQAGKGKVISRPKVITLNNAEAQIQSLEILRVRLPSTGTVINTGAGGSAGANTAATQAIDTGIILRVTPQVSNDGYILLQMFVKSSVPSTATTDDIPNEISRQATSQVLVRDGETVVIGGVYRQQATQAESGVPWLKDIPILGWLFKNRSNQDRRQELLVFITPRVVWRTVQPGALPSAATLWKERDKSAYQIMGPGAGEPNPISAIPG